MDILGLRDNVDGAQDVRADGTPDASGRAQSRWSVDEPGEAVQGGDYRFTVVGMFGKEWGHVDPPRPVGLFVRQKLGHGLGRRPALETFGVILVAFGVLVLLLLGYVYFFTALSAQRSQHALFQSINAEPAATYSLALGTPPPEGRPVAVLEIPALHLVQAVVEGTGASDLRQGPGHMRTTPLPGQPGDSVIAGRRATFGGPFADLGTLRRGQRLTVVDGYGTFHYTVRRVAGYAMGSGQGSGSSSSVLTLVTAASGLLPSGEVAVTAGLVGSPIQGTTGPRFDASIADAGLDGAPGSGSMALAWGLLFVVLLGTVVGVARSWGRPSVVYLIAVPVLLAVGLFACESFVGFLPSTL